MKEAVAQLYVEILRFIQHAVYWYKQGRLAHAWAALAKPWSLSFQKYVNGIDRQARRIDSLASSASKAELRGMHVEICNFRDGLLKAQATIDQLVQMAQGWWIGHILGNSCSFLHSNSFYTIAGAVGCSCLERNNLSHSSRSNTFTSISEYFADVRPNSKLLQLASTSRARLAKAASA